MEPMRHALFFWGVAPDPAKDQIIACSEPCKGEERIARGVALANPREKAIQPIF